MIPSTPSYPTPQRGAALPLTLHLNGAKILILGSGRLAAKRAFTFLEADAQVLVVAPHPLDEAHAEIQHRVEQEQVSYDSEPILSDCTAWINYLQLSGASFICVTDTMINAARRRSTESARLIHEACLQLRLPINISDNPILSTFTFPATHRFTGVDGPSHLQVSVTTNGHGCRLTGRIRREIATRLPPNVGSAVDNVGRLRQRAKNANLPEDDGSPLNTPVPQLDAAFFDQTQQRPRASSSSDPELQIRRMRWVQQMSEYYSYEALARLTSGDMDAALDRLPALNPSLPHHEGIEESQHPSRTGKIYLVGSGPGHPALLTVAALHALRTATTALSDKLVPSEVLALIPSTTNLHIARKFPGNAEGAQSELMQLALDAARRGETVVRLKQGDPFVYGRGGEEVLFFRQHGFESVVIPGVSSALAGPLMTGIPVTQRGVADSLVVCTGVGRAGKSVTLPGYLKSRTLVVLMGVARIKSVVDCLVSERGDGRDGAKYPGHLPIAIIERASSPDQRVLLSTIDGIELALQAVDERPPGMILVGWAAVCLEGDGKVDILDLDEVEEPVIVGAWLGAEGYKVREGLPAEWEELLQGINV